MTRKAINPYHGQKRQSKQCFLRKKIKFIAFIALILAGYNLFAFDEPTNSFLNSSAGSKYLFKVTNDDSTLTSEHVPDKEEDQNDWMRIKEIPENLETSKVSPFANDDENDKQDGKVSTPDVVSESPREHLRGTSSDAGDDQNNALSFKKQHYDVCIAGAGLSGAVIAQQYASQLNQSVLVVEKRDHIAGNCYDYTDEETNIRVSKFGAHLFHTKYERVWEYVQQFSEWTKYEHEVRLSVLR
jgi:hypothetical protein